MSMYIYMFFFNSTCICRCMSGIEMPLSHGTHTQVTSAVGHEKATAREALSHMYEASEIR